MAHFAKIDENFRVLSVEVVANSDNYNSETQQEDENIGIQFLTNIHGWPLWKQCSYNTRNGKHYDSDGNESVDQSKAFRKNYPGIGWTWDESKDMFVPPKPYDSWLLNETTGLWEAPVAYPDDPDQNYAWNESTTSWVVAS